MHASTTGKKLLSSNTSATRPYNMVKFGPPASEIGSLVWVTPVNFNGFRVLAAFSARHSSSGRQPNFAALNRGRRLYSAGRSSRWTLAHILVNGAAVIETTATARFHSVHSATLDAGRLYLKPSRKFELATRWKQVRW